MTPEELAAIRERHRQGVWYPSRAPSGSCFGCGDEWPCDTARSLAHIDAITEAVEGLTTHQVGGYEFEWYCVPISSDSTISEDCRIPDAHYRLVDRDDVLALLRGTPQR